MTRKDYVALAEILGKNKRRKEIITGITMWLLADNSNFDINRFYKKIKEVENEKTT